jgi:hypothetical protein
MFRVKEARHGHWAFLNTACAHMHGLTDKVTLQHMKDLYLAVHSAIQHLSLIRMHASRYSSLPVTELEVCHAQLHYNNIAFKQVGVSYMHNYTRKWVDDKI